jgi:hypothetical protein
LIGGLDANILFTPSILPNRLFARVLNLTASGLRLAMAPAFRSLPR